MQSWVKRHGRLLGGGALALVLIAAGLHHFEEPRFEGRHLSAWLDDMNLSEAEIRRAVKGIGTNAIPCLQEWLISEPTWLELEVRNLNSRQHAFHFDYTPELDRQMRAMRGFFFLEELAQPAVPWLRAGLERHDKNFLFYAQALVSSRGEGLSLLQSMYPGLTTVDKMQIVHAVFYGLMQDQDLAEAYLLFMEDPEWDVQMTSVLTLKQLKRCPPLLFRKLVELKRRPDIEPTASLVAEHFLKRQPELRDVAAP